MSMVWLSRVEGKRNEVRELRAPVYGWFTEGFDTPGLKGAKGCSTSLLLEGGHPSGTPAFRIPSKRRSR